MRLGRCCDAAAHGSALQAPSRRRTYRWMARFGGRLEPNPVVAHPHLGNPDKFSSEIISLLSDFRRLLLCCDSQFSYYRLWSAYRA